MGADLRLLTQADLLAAGEAERTGDYSRVSDAGLKILNGETSHVGGFLTGAREVIDAPAQLLERGVRAVAPGAADWINSMGGSADDATLKGRSDIANLTGGAPSGAGQVAGNIAGTLATAGLTRAPQLAASVLPRAAAQYAARNPYQTAAAAGAVAAPLTSAVEPGAENFWTEKGKQAGLGAAGGVAGRVLTQATGRALQGVTPSREAQLLLDEGVPITPGQLVGGAFGRAENAATSTPWLGSAIAQSYQRGTEGLNRALYRRALAPIGREALADTVEVGRGGVRDVRNELSRAYDGVLDRVTFQADQPFLQNVARVQQMMGSLPEEHQRIFQNTLDTNFGTRLTPSLRASGESVKALESELRRVARIYRGSDRGADRELASALDEVGSQVRQALSRSNPREARALQAIDQGWAQYARLRDAASRAGSEGGVVTPGQLSAAVRAGDHRVGHGGFASGEALGQDLSDAARRVMVSKVPDSGTAGRTLTGLLATAQLHPASTAIPLALAQLYRPGVQRAIVNTMVDPPQVLQQTGRLLQQQSMLPALTGAELAGQ